MASPSPLPTPATMNPAVARKSLKKQKKRQRTKNKKKLDWCRQLLSKQADVSLSLARYVLLNNAKDSENLVLSPPSINVVVGLLAAGTIKSGLEQLLLSYLKSDSIEDVVRLSSELISVILADGSPTGGPKLTVANATWIQNSLPLKPSFKRDVVDTYKAEAFHVDFTTEPAEKIVSEVNLWGEKKTNGLVKNVLPPGSVNPTTRLILANALYFKGEWDLKFDPSRTKEHDFYLLDGGSVKVPFMTDWADRFIGVFDGFKVLRLPYKKGGDGRQFSMYIFLPDSIDGLPVLADKVVSDADFLDKHMPRRKVDVNKLRVPKFKFPFGFEATDAVKNLWGPIKMEFGGDFKIFHKAFIEVNEEGTEDAAVSVACDMSFCLYEPDPGVDFVADHPFLFLIQEDATATMLFLGQVLNPLPQE